MPPKRKAAAVLESPDVETSHKKTRASSDEPTSESDLHCPKIYRQVYDHVFNQEDSDGRSLSEMFETLPSKSELPLYYDIIAEPIDFKTIKKKISTKQYPSFEDFESDILLLIKNVHTFNEPRSQISKDATLLKRAFHSKKQELFKPFKGRKRLQSRTTSVDSEHSEQSEAVKEEKESTPSPKPAETEEIQETQETNTNTKSKPPPPPSAKTNQTPQVKPDVPRSPFTGHSTQYEAKDDGLIDQNFEHNAFSILYNTVVGFTDQSGRRLAQPFLRLPNKRCYANYYEIIKRPVSLTKTRTKIKQNYFSDIHILGKDLVQAFENGLLYNKPGTQAYNDAFILRNYTIEKIEEVAASAEYLLLRENLPRKGRKSLKTEENGDTPRRGRKPIAVNNDLAMPRTPDSQPDKRGLKKKLLQLYNSVVDHKDSEGRVICEMFEELPDEDEYPDYYKVIPNPIDMKTINNKILSMEYNTEDEFIHDFEIMFQNARHYNEESSEVYKDSVSLEKTLKKKRRWLNHLTENKSPSKAPRQSNSPALPILLNKREFSNKAQEILYHIRSYVDESGRSLSEIFERLPSRNDYPDYFLLIKKPIDLAYINSRLNKYPSLEDFEQDMLLLFNNACQYNDPDSQIYKDALTLLREMLKKKQEVNKEDTPFIPNVPSLVQTLLNHLYANILNHKDEEGRTYSDSLMEVEVSFEATQPSGYQRKPISLPIIGQLLKLGFYKRMDRLQDDLFSIFEKARKDGRTDSEMYEDSCELQMYFIMERDRLTKDGMRLMTQALNATQKKVQTEIDVERKAKQQNESSQDDDEEESSDGCEKKNKSSSTRFKGVTAIEVQPEEETLEYEQSTTLKGVEYHIGDFVYLTPEEVGRPSHIMSIEKIWTQKDGLKGIYGNWFCRPQDTFHLASRKFMQRELFRSTHSSYILSSGIISKCYVMSVREFPKLKPKGFDDEDVFVCESRYNGRTKTFKKLKTFPPAASHIELIERETPLEIKRVSSVFNNTSPTETNDSQETKKDVTSSIDIDLQSTEGYKYSKETNCIIEATEGKTFYEKYVTDTDVFKLGDGVYVQSDEGYRRLAKIEKIWTNENGDAYCHCIMFVLPEDTKSMPTQLFSVNECFESNIEEDILISSICGKCSVLTLRDYQSCRPTEMEEKDIYLCSAVYNEDELKFRRNIRGCKRLQLPQHIRDDEYWYFEQPHNPKRRPSLWLVPPTTDEKSKTDETKTTPESETASNENEAMEIDEQSVDMEKIGFALFKKEFSIALLRQQPNIPNSAVNTLSDERWKALTDEQRTEFKERAKRQGLGDHLYVYECAWANCEHQYEILQDLMIHVVEGAHLVRCAETGVFPCKWKSCHRQEKKMPPLKTHSQLVRHMREIHFKATNKKKIIVSDKSKFYFAAHQACDDFRDSETSSRASVTSPLSPRVPPQNGHHFPSFNGMNGQGGPPNGNVIGNNMHAGMYPPFRMNGQAPGSASAALMMQQQLYQQQLMLQQQQQQQQQQGGRRPSAHSRQMQRPSMPSTPGNNPLMQQGVPPNQQPNTPQNGNPLLRPSMTPHQQNNTPGGMMGQQQGPMTPQGPIPNGFPPGAGGPPQPGIPQGGPPGMPPQQQPGMPPQQPGAHGLTPEQQQMLLIQVQQQHHQIMKLQEQVKTLTTNAQNPHMQPQASQQPQAPKPPVFIQPPSTSTTKLRHSEAYLRYIEGLRDNQHKLSNWGELSNIPNKPNPPTAQLPVQWLNGSTHGQQSATDALWALRDHMLKDSITLSKFT
ncbi:protein polybromo-1-like isoform X2 [Clytia hemisphaerica]|uniref:Protein polybromo-1 n=1 Tax=Clytia hemisphaerica TaxID=252671 RepID=A0A7M5V0S5_9CNID